jgi:hypothetical protein
MDCGLQVFKLEKGVRDSETTYRFAVVDYSRARSYPANFVCMLPAKVELVKGKTTNVFGGLFGDKSQDFAVELLNKALISEKDDEVKTEIARRLKLIDVKQVSLVKCSGCDRTFQPRKVRKHKQNLCPECLKKRFGDRQ